MHIYIYFAYWQTGPRSTYKLGPIHHGSQYH